ncbi:glycosyltransferase family protein [Pseudomonas saudiphocaensis]|uniref:glycosyltransferase family protein n=1 Tax=Pseudomonas saudiphocaensis TaxID=1499686 RepID=UPI00187D146D|nr:glycosyltransferase [Pseudomonas saudiphocaensis]MBE7927516.1 glycosyltransferase family 1 protein [Pseudomonas saudiphocaensis]
MRVLVLTATSRLPDFSAVYVALSRHVEVDVRRLDKDQQRNLKAYMRNVVLASYDRVLLDIPFKYVCKQVSLLASWPGLLIYEEDACQNYLATSKWYGFFSRFYKQLPGARIVVTGASVARRLGSEGFDVTFIPKGYDPHTLYDEHQERDIELGFIGRTASKAYQGRKALLDSLSACEPLQLLRVEPGAAYRNMLNRIQYFVSADVGLGEYMAKNFEAMACGCLLIAWRQGEEEQAIGLEDGKHLLLYSSLDELRGHLAALRADPQKAAYIAGAGRDFVARNCSHEALAMRLVTELERNWPPMVLPRRWDWLRSLCTLRRV